MIPANERLRELRKAGFKVKVSHLRRPLSLDGGTVTLRSMHALRERGLLPNPKGGESRVTVIDGENVVASSVARCSNLDTFSRRLGLMIALGRAEKQLAEKGGRDGNRQ